jgi:DNA-binding IclR family transcriptional regulator
MTDDDELFVLANRAFDMFSLAERQHALREFARLKYPRIEDRFSEAVHVVIREADGRSARSTS